MQNSKAFTLIELLVVVAIIGILAAVGVVAYNGYTAAAKEKVCIHNYENLKRLITQHWTLCDLQSSVTLKGQHTNHTDGAERQVACSNFGTIAGETVKHFTNFATSPYDPDSPYNIEIMSYIGNPPKDGQIAYYPESAGFKLRTRCRGKVTYYQWPKASFP